MRPTRTERRGEDGFTLPEMVIAILLLGLFVVGFMSAVQVLATTSGHARVEAALRDYATSVSDTLRAEGWDCSGAQHVSTVLTSQVAAVDTDLRNRIGQAGSTLAAVLDDIEPPVVEKVEIGDASGADGSPAAWRNGNESCNSATAKPVVRVTVVFNRSPGTQQMRLRRTILVARR